jgi:chaperonin GroES
MNLKPMHDWAVIRPSEAAQITAGGLYIPETAKDKPHEGVVEAIGPGAFEEEKRGKKALKEKKDRKFIPTVVKPGNRVLYERYAGQTYKIGNEDWILVRERDILGILPDKPAMPHQPRPLQIPATTTNAAPAALIVSPAAARASTVKKVAAKPVKKSGKKTVAKKAKAGKAVTGKNTKKAAKKKATAKPVKKAATRPVKTKKKAKKKSR